jgi:hypothetical protein
LKKVYADAYITPTVITSTYNKTMSIPFILNIDPWFYESFPSARDVDSQKLFWTHYLASCSQSAKIEDADPDHSLATPPPGDARRSDLHQYFVLGAGHEKGATMGETLNRQYSYIHLETLKDTESIGQLETNLEMAVAHEIGHAVIYGSLKFPGVEKGHFIDWSIMKDGGPKEAVAGIQNDIFKAENIDLMRKTVIWGE